MNTKYINNATVDFDIEIIDFSNKMHQLQLVCLVYFGQEHFTSRIIGKDKHIQYSSLRFCNGLKFSILVHAL